MKACLIGVSGWAGVHYQDLMGLHERGDAQLLAATVINQDEEAEKCNRLREIGCRVFDDYREMLDAVGAAVDMCFIPVGIHLHAPMTIDALRAGTNVFVEKPAAATIDEVRAMRAAEVETGRFVAVGYQSMYARETLAMKSLILDGALGRITAIRTRCCWPREQRYYRRNPWAGKMKVGERWVLDSPFNNAAAHQLNMICFLAGSALTRTARLASIEAEVFCANDIEGPDTACLRIETLDGPVLSFHATHACEQNHDPRIVVIGEEGQMTWDSCQSLEVVDRSGRVYHLPVEPEWPRDFLLRALDRRLADPNAFVCDLEIAAAQTICVNGAHESSPVHPITERFLRHELGLTSIVGIEALVQEAFTDGRLFSELGVAWAHAGHDVSLIDYDHFDGPRSV